MSVTERIPLAAVPDLIAIWQALPFRVLDTQERLLLNEGQTVGSERQFDRLTERGAWVASGPWSPGHAKERRDRCRQPPPGRLGIAYGGHLHRRARRPGHGDAPAQ